MHLRFSCCNKRRIHKHAYKPGGGVCLSSRIDIFNEDKLLDHCKRRVAAETANIYPCFTLDIRNLLGKCRHRRKRDCYAYVILDHLMRPSLIEINLLTFHPFIRYSSKNFVEQMGVLGVLGRKMEVGRPHARNGGE